MGEKEEQEQPFPLCSALCSPDRLRIGEAAQGTQVGGRSSRAARKITIDSQVRRRELQSGDDDGIKTREFFYLITRKARRAKRGEITFVPASLTGRDLARKGIFGFFFCLAVVARVGVWVSRPKFDLPLKSELVCGGESAREH